MKNIAYLNLKDINAPYEAEIKTALAGVVDSGWYLFGENVARFEKEWAAYCSLKHCIACSNGLDALRLVLKAWMEMGKLNKGDEVIVPANTYIATILAVSDCGLSPILIEPDAKTYLITAETIEKAITPKTRIILPVHLYGQLCEMEEITSLAKKHDLLILEDCAQAHTHYSPFGSCSSSSALPKTHYPARTLAFSFYPGKNLGALGDAGAVVTDDTELADIVRKIANYGSTKKYVHDHKGVNSRMDELQATILNIKLSDLDRCNQRRIEIAARYNNEIKNPLIILPKISTESVYHIYPIRCDRRDELQQYLCEQGVSTQIHYLIPPHKQLAYNEWEQLSYHITEEIAKTELSLPCNQAMTEEEVTSVINAVNNFK